MTIYQLKALNEKNGGLWFSRRAMKGSNDTMRQFRIRRINADVVEVRRVHKPELPSVLFSTKTGRTL
jgi:hypothetical protein